MSKPESGRRRRTGKQRLVSTSAHLPYAHLEAIEEMGRSPSEYLRQAVLEKLERDKGFLPEIRRVEDEIQLAEEGLESLQSLRASLLVKHQEFVATKMVEDARVALSREFLTREYSSEEEFVTDARALPEFAELGIGVMGDLASEVWREFRG